MDLFTLETMELARSFEQLSAGFRRQVPARFNLAWDCCGRHAVTRERFALYFEDEEGATAAFSFCDIQQAANRLSNALHALGVQRGQRIAILLPQRPETAIAHIAAYQMGAIALPLSHLFGPDALEYRLRDAAACVAIGAMGRAYPGHRISLLDESGNEVADGEVGEIAVWRTGVPVMFLEYWRNAEATTSKFSGDWGRTGDLASRDGDGFFWYKGRTDDMIKSAGCRVGPAEIENCQLKHTAVANAAVIGVPDRERGEVIRACIVPNAGTAASEALKEQIQERVRLASYQYPREIEFLDALPMTTTGKVQRR